MFFIPKNVRRDCESKYTETSFAVRVYNFFIYYECPWENGSMLFFFFDLRCEEYPF